MPAEASLATGRRSLGLAWVLIAAGTLAYSSSFGGEFVFDDRYHINEHLPRLAAQGFGQTRPLLYVTLYGNYVLGGLHPGGYHLVNLAIHLTAGCLLFGLARRLLRISGIESDGVAFAIALLWLVHPLQTQSVTYLIQRSESLMGMFYLATLYSLVRSAQAASWPVQRSWEFAAICCCWAGMLSKEVMVTAPLAALLMDRIFLCSSWTEWIRKRGALYALLTAPGILLVVHLIRTGAFTSVAATFHSETYRTRAEYLATQPVVVLHYLWLTVSPHPLCIDYQWPVSKGAATMLFPALAILGLLGVTGWALWRWPRVGFLAATFFLILAPTSSIFPIADLAMEHRMYLPLAPLSALAVLGANHALQHLAQTRGWTQSQRRAAAAAALTVVATALGVLTFARNFDYHEPTVFWTRVTEVVPHNARAWLHLGLAQQKAGQAQDAAESFQQVCRLKPDAEAYYNLGTHLLLFGEPALAVEPLRKAAQLDPSDLSSRFNWGRALLETSRIDEAVNVWEQACSATEGTSGDTSLMLSLRLRLAAALISQKKGERALLHLQECLRQDPENRVAHELLQALASPSR